MKKILYILVSICIGNYAFGQQKIGEICHWDGNKKAAVALTFDDWLTTHPTIVVPALQERNMVATFYFIAKDLNTSKITQLNNAIALGNEIGNHTMTHPSSDSAIAVEARPAKEKLDAALTTPVLTYDYPYGTFTNAIIDSVRKSGHIASRGVWSPSSFGYNFASNDNDYYNLRTVGVGGDGVKTTKDFAKYLTKVANGGGFVTYLYHGVAKSSDYANIPKDSLYSQLDTLKSLEDKLWITTVANAIKYHREARCASLSESNNSNSEFYVIELTDTLPNDVFNQPLTVKIYNNGKTFCEIKQNDEDCPILYQTYEYVMFRAIPDNGAISLKYGDWTVNAIKNIDEIASIVVKGDTIQITTDDNANVEIHSITGTVLSKQTGSCQYTFRKSGTYIVTVNGLSKTIVINR